MKSLYRYFLNAPTTLTLILLTPAAFIFNLWASNILTESYIASKFPVPYFVAQLSFNPEQLKTWYGVLIEQGMLDKFLQTQHIDSLFIVSTLLLHCVVLLLISRLFAANSKGRKIMVICALISAIAPACDQLENLVSYVMLANPRDFFSGLAYIYSSFAAIKFAFFVFAYVTAAIGLVAGLISVIIRSKKSPMISQHA
ncbi:MAG TPA: hypothetical protein PK002_01560 [Cellvibrio sp.]|nr:hypothetical protein [Cellvibrio sp.]